MRSISVTEKVLKLIASSRFITYDSIINDNIEKWKKREPNTYRENAILEFRKTSFEL